MRLNCGIVWVIRFCNAWGYKAKLEESVKDQKNHQLPDQVIQLVLLVLLLLLSIVQRLQPVHQEECNFIPTLQKQTDTEHHHTV